MFPFTAFFLGLFLAAGVAFAQPAGSGNGGNGYDENPDKFSGAFANVFTPNGDGLNDVFNPAPNQLLNYRISIYNRWGKEVFSGNQSTPWDGRSNGSPVPEGVYVYYIEGTAANGETFERSSTIMVIR